MTTSKKQWHSIDELFEEYSHICLKMMSNQVL